MWKDGRLLVRKESSALNSIFVKGAKADDEFALTLGEQFVIGNTTFTLQDGEAPPNLTELTCSTHELQQVKFTDADKRIEVLAALPGIIRYSPSNEELESRVVDVLLRGIPRADGAAVVWLDPSASADDPHIKVRCARHRGTDAFKPTPAGLTRFRRRSVLRTTRPR